MSLALKNTLCPYLDSSGKPSPIRSWTWRWATPGKYSDGRPPENIRAGKQRQANRSPPLWMSHYESLEVNNDFQAHARTQIRKLHFKKINESLFEDLTNKQTNTNGGSWNNITFLPPWLYCSYTLLKPLKEEIILWFPKLFHWQTHFV